MDATQAVVVAASVGAAGAVTGQIVAAIFTARRESKRLRWEQEQANLRRADEVARLHLETKRQAFTSFLQLAVTRCDLLMKASITHDEKRDATCSQVEKTADQCGRTSIP